MRWYPVEAAAWFLGTLLAVAALGGYAYQTFPTPEPEPPKPGPVVVVDPPKPGPVVAVNPPDPGPVGIVNPPGPKDKPVPPPPPPPPPPPAPTLAFGALPAAGIAGAPLEAITVKVGNDPDGKQDGQQVALELIDPKRTGATLGGAARATIEHGVAKFTALTVSKAGEFRLRAALMNGTAEPHTSGIFKLARKEPPPPPATLSGDVLVLVLATDASTTKTDDEMFSRELQGLAEELGTKLLGGSLYVLNQRAKEPWKAGAVARAQDRFANAKYTDMFKEAVQTIKKARAQAENKEFRTLLIWRSDYNPDFDVNAAAAVRPDDRMFLCYWFVRANTESKTIQAWFGNRAAHVAGGVNLREFAADILR